MKTKPARFEVVLESGGNPDHDQFYGTNILSPTVVRVCSSVEECQIAVRHYVQKWNLGGGNWTGGKVTRNGTDIGRISYNGRFWPKAGLAPAGAEGREQRGEHMI